MNGYKSLCESIEEDFKALGLKGVKISSGKGLFTEGKTSELLKSQMSKMKWFKKFSDKQWEEFGRWLKFKRVFKSVFSGAFVPFMKFTFSGGRFPATERYCEDNGLKSSRYDTAMLLNTLADDYFLEREEVRVKDVLRGVNHTDQERELIQDEHGNIRYPIFVYGDMAYETLEYLENEMKMKVPDIV